MSIQILAKKWANVQIVGLYMYNIDISYNSRFINNKSLVVKPRLIFE